MADYLSREAILAASDLEAEDVEVPEWGGKVRVRPLNGRERAEIEELMFSENGAGRKQSEVLFRERMVALTVVGEDGKRAFTDQDVQALSEKNWRALERIALAAVKISGLTAEALDELVGKSAVTPTGGSAIG